MALRLREVLIVLAMLAVGLVFYAWLFGLL
jgi:hypothetical protein